MKRGWAMAVAAAMAATSLGIAAPARAADCDGSAPRLPQSNTVWLENGQIRINPNGVRDDVTQYRVYLQARVAEVLGCVTGLVPAQVWCLTDKILEIVGDLDPSTLDLRYVYQDPMTGDIVIDYALLLADATACV